MTRPLQNSRIVVMGSSPEPMAVLRGHAADVQALTFHPDLDILYSGQAMSSIASILARKGVSRDVSACCNHNRATDTSSASTLLTHFLIELSSMTICRDAEGQLLSWSLAARRSTSRLRYIACVYLPSSKLKLVNVTKPSEVISDAYSEMYSWY